MISLLVFLYSLVWGSFLNVVACRLMNNQSVVTPRSHCPNCKAIIAWYDNIPVISWVLLHGRCRECKESISWLYPSIEIVTALTFVALYHYVSSAYLFSYFILFSALIVTIRTDLEYMLIIPEISLYPIVAAFILSYAGLLPISLAQSIIGAIVGYGLLWSIAKCYYLVTKQQGLGEGDFDLMALIGAFTAIEGIISTLFIGSWVGSIIGITYLLVSKKGRECRLPFAPFLAFGAMTYVYLQNSIHLWLLSL